MGETIKEWTRDGFELEAVTEQDYDYQPGQDDDVYPQISWGPLPRVSCEDCDGSGYRGGWDVDTNDDCPACSGSGEVDDAGVSVSMFPNGEPGHITRAELEQVAEVTGAPLETIAADGAAIANGDLSFVGVIVTARRNGLEASTSLWGIDYDARRRRQSDEYLEEVAEDLASEAIDNAAREVLGGLAPLALNY